MIAHPIFERGNDAVDTNPPYQNPDIHITSHGSDVYWAVFGVMSLSAIVFTVMAAKRPRLERVFHHINIAVVVVAAIAYYTMASNLGSTSTRVEFERNKSTVFGLTRQIFYVRYIDWFLTTPLLLLELLLTAGMNRSNIWFTLLMDEVMVVCGLVGALTFSRYKWGYFTFACIAYLYIAWNIVRTAGKKSGRIGSDVGGVYRRGSFYLATIWLFYPIAWGLCEGGNVISPDSEAVFYGVLDILAKPVFAAYMLFAHRNLPIARFGLARWEDPEVGLDGHAPLTGYGQGHGLGHGLGHGMAENVAPGRVSGATASSVPPSGTTPVMTHHHV